MSHKHVQPGPYKCMYTHSHTTFYFPILYGVSGLWFNELLLDPCPHLAYYQLLQIVPHVSSSVVLSYPRWLNSPCGQDGYGYWETEAPKRQLCLGRWFVLQGRPLSFNPPEGPVSLCRITDGSGMGVARSHDWKAISSRMDTPNHDDTFLRSESRWTGCVTSLGLRVLVLKQVHPCPVPVNMYCGCYWQLS